MAEAVVAISFVSAIASLIDNISRSLSRLHEFKAAHGQAPAVYQDVLNQLPLLLEIVQKLQTRSLEASQDRRPPPALSSAISGCIRQVDSINRTVEKWTPSAQTSSIMRIRKAFGSVHNERKLLQALGVLEMYKTTLHMYLTSSPGLDIPKPTTGMYDLPASQLSYFAGREEFFQALSQFMEETSVSSTVPRAIVLTGMGGQGKTQIALEYCRRARASGTFDYIFWMDATTEKSLIRSYSDAAGKLTESGVAFLDDKSRISYVRRFFARISQRWLFVFDNFDRPDLFPDIVQYMPSSNTGAFIITSRHSESERLGLAIAVPGLQEDDSVQLLMHRAKSAMTQENIASAKMIAQKLGHLPLALDQAGSYLSFRRLPLKSFFEHDLERKKMILRHTPSLWEYRKRLSDHERETSINAFTTFEMSLDQVSYSGEPSAITHFFTLCAFLDRSKIEDSVFQSYLLSQPEPLEWMKCFTTNGHWDVYKYQDLVASLQVHSLVVARDTGISVIAFSIHPLIRDWLRLRIPEAEQLDYVREAIEVVAATIRKLTSEHVSCHARRILIGHIDACVENTREILHEAGKWVFSYLEDSTDAFASTYNAHGRFADAAFLYKSLLAYQRQTGSHHLLRTGINLGNVLRNLGQYSEAEELYLQILTDRTSQLGPVHADTLRALEGLAVIHSLQEKFELADQEYQQLLRDLDRIDGDSRPATLRALEGLANVHRHQARYDTARALYGMALQEQVESSGARSPDSLRCVEGLSIVYRHQSRLEESIHLYQQILGNLESIFANDHPYMLRTSFNLSVAFYHQGKYMEAESMAERAHRGFEALLGSEHVDTKRTKEQLAGIRASFRNRFSPIPQSQPLPEVQEILAVQQQCHPLYEIQENHRGAELEIMPGSSSELLPPQFHPITELLGMAHIMDTGVSAETSKGNEPVANECMNTNTDAQQSLKLGVTTPMHARLTALLQKSEKSGVKPMPPSDGTDHVLCSDHAVGLLLEHYALGPNMKDLHGRTPLLRAAHSGDADLVSLLSQRKDVQINVQCKLGYTALIYATDGGYEQIMRTLLERKDTDASIEDNHGLTALDHAIHRSGNEAIRVLLDSKRMDVIVGSSLSHAFSMSKTESSIGPRNHSSADLGMIMLKAGRTQGRRQAIPYDSQGVNEAFFEALDYENTNLASLLFKTKLVNINTRYMADSPRASWGRTKTGTYVPRISGETPLHEAAQCGNHQRCARLLNFNADASIKDSLGNTALFRASAGGHDMVVELLLNDARSDPNVVNNNGRSPLYYAFQRGHEKVVQRLLSAGAMFHSVELEALKLLAGVTRERRHAMLQMVYNACGQHSRAMSGLE